jgi:hypothetical protein
VNKPPFTVEDQIGAVERLIEDLRWARNDPTVPEHRTYTILKSLATDLRARLDGASNRTLDALAFQVESATKAKARIGYVEVGHHQAVSECVMANWPVIKRALEDCNRETTS